MMGSLWLVNLPQWLEDANLPYRLYKGWETRARSSGGYDGIYAIGYHHDASGVNSSDQANEDYCWLNADSRPIGAVRIRRDGSVTVGAAGATNTMGKGGPLTCSTGTVPQDRGNQYMFAIEAANNGIGEPWSKNQLDSYFRLCAILCEQLGLQASDCYSHWAYCQPSCPGRKIDPAGPTPSYPDVGGTTGTKTWSTSAFRSHVAAAMGQKPPEPEPEPPPSGGDYSWMASLPTIKKGQSGAYVERMQHLLAAAGYMNPANTANYDGVWGTGTDDAKRRFDSDHGLASSDTSCGPKSWESLLTGKKW